MSLDDAARLFGASVIFTGFVTLADVAWVSVIQGGSADFGLYLCLGWLTYFLVLLVYRVFHRLVAMALKRRGGLIASIVDSCAGLFFALMAPLPLIFAWRALHTLGLLTGSTGAHTMLKAFGPEIVTMMSYAVAMLGAWCYVKLTQRSR